MGSLKVSGKQDIASDLLIIRDKIGVSSVTHCFNNDVGIGSKVDVFDDDLRTKASTSLIGSSLKLVNENDKSQLSYSKAHPSSVNDSRILAIFFGKTLTKNICQI